MVVATVVVSGKAAVKKSAEGATVAAHTNAAAQHIVSTTVAGGSGAICDSAVNVKPVSSVGQPQTIAGSCTRP